MSYDLNNCHSSETIHGNDGVLDIFYLVHDSRISRAIENSIRFQEEEHIIHFPSFLPLVHHHQN